MGEVSPNDMLSWDNLIYLADFFLKSGEFNMSLLGGEPLLHPEISEFIIYLSKRGICSSIFTSGITTDAKFDKLSVKLSDVDYRYRFICNVNDPTKSPAKEQPKVDRFLSRFGERTTLSFNIYELGFSLDFLVEYINKYGLNRHIRLGLAHPVPNLPNNCINPRDFHKIAEKLSSYYEILKDEDIELGFDCGFPMCVFTPEQIGKMFLISNGRLSFECGPAIDIGPDMDVWACFPMSGYEKRSIYEFESLKEISDHFMDKMNELRDNQGVFDSCTECVYRRKGMCSGGCISHVINRKG